MASAGEQLLPAVRPLAVPDDHGLELIPAGSAVLIWHRGARYVLSAAHVIEEYPDRAYYLGTQTAWREIQGPWRVNLSPGRNRESDNLDVAFNLVDDGFAESLDGCAFLTAERQATREHVEFQPPYRSKYFVIGYQNNAFEFRRYSRTTVPSSIGYAATIASPSSHVETRLNPHLNIVLDYEWDSVIAEQGTQRSPKLDGISGGGIFRMPSLEDSRTFALPTLVGITIEERRRERLMVGTRLNVFFHLIAGDGRNPAPEAAPNEALHLTSAPSIAVDRMDRIQTQQHLLAYVAGRLQLSAGR